MKLTDFLEDVGRPVAYYPGLALALGGVKQAILLCQMIYWVGKGADPEGWIYKTQEELRDETGLSFDEQRTARKVLCGFDLMSERYARLEHRLYFKVNTDAVNDFWENWRNGERQFPEMAKPNFGKSGNPTSGNEDSPLRYKGTETTPKTTSETTTEKSLPLKEEFPVSSNSYRDETDFVFPENLWRDN